MIFAYTIKGWSLPIEGHPENHSALLTRRPVRGARRASSAPTPREPWAPFDAGQPARTSCARPPRPRSRARSPRRGRRRPCRPTLGRKHRGSESTQQAFGRFFVDLVHEAPEVAERVVTVSPDVASLDQPRRLDQQGRDLVGGGPARLVRGRPADARALARDDGRPPHRARHRRDQPGRPARRARRHLEPLRPAAAADRHDLRPVRRPRARALVVRDLRGRAVDPRRHAVAASRSRRRAAPTSRSSRPSIGIGQPGCTAWEPAFGQDLEWALLHALSRLGRPGGESAYFRLSTRPIDQSLAGDAHERRELVLAGGYPLRRASGAPGGHAGGHGRRDAGGDAAADVLGDDVDVLCVTSADLLFRAFRARAGFGEHPDDDPRRAAARRPRRADRHRARRRPERARLPAAVNATPLTPLGVTSFGQSGDLEDVYGHHEIDAETVVGAALDLL